ncbi:MAG: PqqD family protein [Caldilineaceae bacterium]
MITLQTQVQPDPNVLSTTLSNQETVLLHMQSNYYYSLNETGVSIWQGLSQGRTLNEISQILVDQYAITLAEAEQAVLTLLNDLIAEHLVQPMTTPAPRSTHG